MGDARISDDFLMATELEGTQYQAGSMTRRAGEKGYPGGSSAASRSEFRRMLEKSGDNEGVRLLSAREKYIEMMKARPSRTSSTTRTTASTEEHVCPLLGGSGGAGAH